jgi:hypothetical protein
MEMKAKFYAHKHFGVGGSIEAALSAENCPDHATGRPLTKDDFREIDAREYYGTVWDLDCVDGEWRQ